MKKQDIAGRLKASRIKAGYKTASDFCKKNSIAVSSYILHELGSRGIKIPVVEKYAKLLNISPAWLLSGDNAYHFVETQIKYSVLSLKEAIQYEKNIIESKQLTYNFELTGHKSIFIIHQTGNSMTPVFNHNATLFIDPTLYPIKDNSFVLVKVPQYELPIIRQLIQAKYKYFLTAINQEYPPIEENPNINIIGTVVYSISSHCL